MMADRPVKFTPTTAGASVSAYPGPDDIQRVELPNGIVVLSRINTNSPAVVIKGYLPAGGLNDPDRLLGLADFCATALLRGTENYDFHQIYDRLESAGARLGMSSGVHLVNFSGQSLVEDLDMLLDLLAEGLRRPTFPDGQVERLRAQLLTGLAIRSQSTRDMAGLSFDQIVYEDHPYSRPSDGYTETVAAITGSDLAGHHREYYGPRGMVITIVGAVEPEAAVERVRAHFGDWLNPGQGELKPLPLLKRLTETITRRVDIAGKSQTDIVLGAAGPSRLEDDYIAATLGNSVLGRFGMMGRIGASVRDRAGLAYYAHSSLSGGLGPGPWYVSAGVDPENVDKAIELILDELSRFIQDGVTGEELADVQNQFIGSLPLSLESNAGVASALVTMERYQLGLDYLRRYPEMIGSITRQDVLEAAHRYLDVDRLGIAVAGP